MDTTASEAGCPSLIPPKGDVTTGSTSESLCQQTPIHAAVIAPESIPPIPSAPALHAGAVPALGPTYKPVGPSGPIVYPRARSNPPPDMQAVTRNKNLQEAPPPSYDSVVPVQPFQRPLPMQYPPYQQYQPLSTYPTNYNQPNQPPVHSLPQPPGVIFVQMPYQGAVVQQPRPLPPVRTSFKFQSLTDDNQYYIAICVLVCVIVCVNPLAAICAISGLYFAYKSAHANQQNVYEEARKNHRIASMFNIGAVLTIAFGFPVILGIIYYTAANYS